MSTVFPDPTNPSYVPVAVQSNATYALQTMQAGYNSAWKYADAAFDNSMYFLESMYNAVDPSTVKDIPKVNLTVSFPDPNLTNIQVPDVPESPTDLSPVIPQVPASPTLSAVAGINLPSTPQFLAEFPTLELPAVPSPLSATEPGAAPGFSSPDIPVSPDTVLPTAPTLAGYNLPTPPSITLPEFSHSEPNADDITSPGGTINFTEELYDSALLSASQSRLLAAINSGDSGLPDSIVNQMWEQERNRATKVSVTAKMEAMEVFASRGFAMPPGALEARMREIDREAELAHNEASRTKAIEDAQRAYDFVKFALSITVQLETQLMSYTNSMYQRALEVQTTLYRAGIDIYNAKVGLYNAKVQAWIGYTQVFRAQLEAELSKLEVYKSEIEAQQLIGQLNSQKLEAYKIGIDAVNSIVAKYKTEMEAAAIEADIQKQALEAYRAEVEAYQAKVEAKAVEYKGYAEQVNAEISKTRIYETAAQAYNSEVGAFRALVDAEGIRIRGETELNKSRVTEYEAKIRAFATLVEAERTRITASLDSFRTEVAAFEAELRAEVAQSETERSNYAAQVEAASKEADLRLKEAEVNITSATNNLSMYNKSLEAGASISEQLAASALDVLSISAQGTSSYTESA